VRFAGGHQSKCGRVGLPVKGNGCHRNHNNMGMLMEFSISPWGGKFIKLLRLGPWHNLAWPRFPYWGVSNQVANLSINSGRAQKDDGSLNSHFPCHSTSTILIC